MTVDIWAMLWLAGAGILAGFVDSIAGGGGIITLPALLAAGIPPHQALATNKLQSSFGSVTSAFNYSRLGLMQPSELWVGVLFTLFGAAAGAVIVQFFAADTLENLIIVMLVAILFYTLMTPGLGKDTRPHRVPHLLFYTGAGLALGFYDGFFGPGTGSFWTMALILGLGLDLKSATAQTKLFNAVSNLVSLAVFVYAGLVLWGVGIAMGAGQIVGAWAGSTLVHRRQVGFVRTFFLLVVAATILKLLWQRYWG